MIRFGVLAAGSLSLVAASPCVAAATDPGDWRAGERRSGAFAGMAVKMPLGTRSRAAPSARLQLGTTQSYRGGSSGAPLGMRLQGSAVELGLAGRKPMLFVGGRSTKSLKERAQMSGGNSWLYVAGAVVVAGAVLLTVLNDGDDSEPCFPGNC